MNETSIRHALELIKQPGEVIEVRVIGQRTFSGYFKDVENLVKQVKRYQNDNIYFVLNEISEECYDREQQEVIKAARHTTSDNDIVARRWLLVDIDSKRATGVGATEEEKRHAKDVGNRVYAFLRDIGFSKPICADSGNGMHLLYSIYLDNSPEKTQIVKDVLQVLDMFFSNEKAQIDTSVFNLSRITKLYGTTARKGRNTRERPHRLSGIIRSPEEVKITDISLLRKVAAMLPVPEEKNRWNNYGADRFDLDDFINRHGIKVKSETEYGGGKKYVLNHCLFDPSHAAKDAAIFKLANGAIGYKCLHNSCADYKWQDVRKMFEPNAYERTMAPRYEKFDTKPQAKRPQVEHESKGDKFLQLHEIKNIDRSKLVYIRSRMQELDKKIIGFLKGDISIWSGHNASGKSTILGQMCLTAINEGFKALMYSGELQPHRVKSWLQLQAAGRQFTMPTEFENLYYVPSSTGVKIDSWLKDKFFLYNNNYGSEYNQLTADLSERLSKGDIDVVVLDNIMTLDLNELASDANTKQSNAIKSISDLAKKYDVHIHIVAHPKKTQGLIRKQDISGTYNLSNVADNIFIIHRVNNDFIKSSSEYYGNAESAWMHRFNNIIEVCKNRDLGVMDYSVGVYFEKESKRFLNEPFENIVYGWQEIGLQKSIDYQHEPEYNSPSPILTSTSESDLPFEPDGEPLPF